MKLKIMDATKKELKDIEMPSQFSEEIRPDLIKRAVHAIEANQRQPYGADPDAGTRSSARTSKRRRHYRGTYGIGISRVPRKVMSRSGTRFNFVAAFAPGIVGGRRAHPPKAEKVWKLEINDKERKKAIRSAIAASVSKDYVKSRGHKIPDIYPFVLSSKIEELAKTSDVEKMLMAFGFDEELRRTSQYKVRAGRGKSRGRKYNEKVGILFVVSTSCSLQKAAKNIPGVEVCLVEKLNAKLLAPGANPGRATLYSEAALERMNAEKLFFNNSLPKVRVAKKKEEKSESKNTKNTKTVAVAQKPKKESVKEAKAPAKKSKK